jgi:hypothetical protein
MGRIIQTSIDSYPPAIIAFRLTRTSGRKSYRGPSSIVPVPQIEAEILLEDIRELLAASAPVARAPSCRCELGAASSPAAQAIVHCGFLLQKHVNSALHEFHAIRPLVISPKGREIFRTPSRSELSRFLRKRKKMMIFMECSTKLPTLTRLRVFGLNNGSISGRGRDKVIVPQIGNPLHCCQCWASGPR